VDRNILRMAIYEMFFADDVPPIVAINEAIDIAKKFGTEESGKFVNGVLDRVKLDLNRPLRTVSNPAI
jgi:N utilization substance protein B